MKALKKLGKQRTPYRKAESHNQSWVEWGKTLSHQIKNKTDKQLRLSEGKKKNWGERMTKSSHKKTVEKMMVISDGCACWTCRLPGFMEGKTGKKSATKKQRKKKTIIYEDIRELWGRRRPFQPFSWGGGVRKKKSREESLQWNLDMGKISNPVELEKFNKKRSRVGEDVFNPQ